MTDLMISFMVMIQAQLLWIIYKTARLEQRLKDLTHNQENKIMEMIENAYAKI